VVQHTLADHAPVDTGSPRSDLRQQDVLVVYEAARVIGADCAADAQYVRSLRPQLRPGRHCCGIRWGSRRG
jgi:hypothetical protein